MALDLSGIVGAAKAEPPRPTTFTAHVVRVDESGLWVVPIGEDPRHPYGPCKGGWTPTGARVPVGAMVMLAETPDGPWVAALDAPPTSIPDAVQSVHNGSFELVDEAGGPGGWTVEPVAGVGTHTITLPGGDTVHGVRFLRANLTPGFDPSTGLTLYGVAIQSTPWTAEAAGSAIQLSWYARSAGGNLIVSLISAPPGQEPVSGEPGVVETLVRSDELTASWVRYRGMATVPPTHNRISVRFGVYALDEVPVTFDIDRVLLDGELESDQATLHADYVRRAAATLAGGGIRLVTAGGNVAWSQPLTIAAAGIRVDQAPAGRFEIAMPPAGTVIPVHHSAARTSHTVAGGVIALDPDDALWYELPLGQPSASQPGRFHILGSNSADGYAVPPAWILVVRRGAWSTTQHAPEYSWGDGRAHDPWRTPSLNTGWLAGTVPPRFAKAHDGDVRMKGRVKSGVGSAFTLPPGYWPDGTFTTYVRDGNGAPALLTVTDTGVVTTSGNNTDHSIDCRFPADK